MIEPVSVWRLGSERWTEEWDRRQACYELKDEQQGASAGIIPLLILS